jgi:hypothetical protein
MNRLIDLLALCVAQRSSPCPHRLPGHGRAHGHRRCHGVLAKDNVTLKISEEAEREIENAGEGARALFSRRSGSLNFRRLCGLVVKRPFAAGIQTGLG